MRYSKDEIKQRKKRGQSDRRQISLRFLPLIQPQTLAQTNYIVHQEDAIHARHPK